MKNLISIPKGISTLGILRQVLDDIEHKTGYRPLDWMSDVYDEAYEYYMIDDQFDWDGFELHLTCAADSFVDFIIAHYQNLNNSIETFC